MKKLVSQFRFAPVNCPECSQIILTPFTLTSENPDHIQAIEDLPLGVDFPVNSITEHNCGKIKKAFFRRRVLEEKRHVSWDQFRIHIKRHVKKGRVLTRRAQCGLYVSSMESEGEKTGHDIMIADGRILSLGTPASTDIKCESGMVISMKDARRVGFLKYRADALVLADFELPASNDTVPMFDVELSSEDHEMLDLQCRKLMDQIITTQGKIIKYIPTKNRIVDEKVRFFRRISFVSFLSESKVSSGLEALISYNVHMKILTNN